MNKEESLRCLEIAKRHRDSGNLDAAIKFCNKSIALFPSDAATALLSTLRSPTSASASGAEPHASSTSTRHRASDSTTTASSSKEDPERVATVRRIRACRATQYYEILGLKKDCSEADIKKAFRKLAIQTHPDKSDVKGADEAFKMVGRAWQVLGDATLRAQYDASPDHDPTSRTPSTTGPHQFRGGPADVSPEELFNMFFGGGGGGGFGGTPVFTASFGPNGFQRTGPRPQAGADRGQHQSSSLIQLLPIIILFAISFIGSLPSISNLFTTPDPHYAFTPTQAYSSERTTSSYKVPYFVNPREFESHPIYQSIPLASRDLKQAGTTSQTLRSFENGIERVYVGSLRNLCNREVEEKERRTEYHKGFFGIGADWDKVAEIRAEPLPSCERLRDMGLLSY